jgi:hypothetical protein
MSRLTLLFYICLCAHILAQNGPTITTVDGFITRAANGNSLRVGGLTVKLAAQTACSRYIAVQGESHIFPIRTSLENLDSCSSLNLPVGSRIHAFGTLQADRTFIATKLTVGNSLKVSTGELPVSSFGSEIDWRLDDKYSGAPWTGKAYAGAFAEETPAMFRSNSGTNVRLWINGFPLCLTGSTRIYVPSSKRRIVTKQLYPDNSAGSVIFRRSKMSVIPFTTKLIKPKTYVVYRASKVDGETRASEIYLFHYVTSDAEREYLAKYAPSIVDPDYRSHIPGELRYKNGETIKIVPDRRIQAYVSTAANEVIPPYQKQLQLEKNSQINIRCFVVSTFKNIPTNYYVQIDGHPTDSSHLIFTNLKSLLTVPKDVKTIRRIVAMPDGTVLIPDVELASFENKAQMEFALSAAISSIVQRQAYFNKIYQSSTPDPSVTDGYFQTQRVIRFGIHQMYLAGYDVREAPYVWALARGKPVNNPIIDSKDPNKEIPWYAAYAFDYISQYYKDVDYSKLKRGDAEYATFLQELRKADPVAFATSKK